MKAKQFEMFEKPTMEHGGSIGRGRRKAQRPFDRKRAMHIVVRSLRASGAWNFLNPRHKLSIYALLIHKAERYGAKIYRFENVGNHIHILMKFPDRHALISFLRTFTQGLMFLVTGAKKGNPKGKFFETLAYTKVISWGREFQAVKNYLWKNMLESFGFSAEEVKWAREANRGMP